MLILLFELFFLLFIGKRGNWFLISLFSLIISFCYYLVLSFVPKKINKKITNVSVIILILIYIFQFIYFQIFGDLLSISTILDNSDAVVFYQIVLNKILVNWYVIFIYLLLGGLYLFLINKEKIVIKKSKFYYIIPVLFIVLFIYFSENNDANKKDFILLKSVKEYGLLITIKDDIKNYFFPSNDSVVYTVNEGKYNTKEYNILDIDFPISDDSFINEISNYLENQEPTKKNEYTGIFENKNLIVILAESFSELSIDEDITPTLYRLYNNSIKFNNYYSPLYRVGTADGEYVVDNSLLPIDKDTALIESNDNYLIYNYANVFKSLDYNIFAYHNYDYDYYDRNVYFGNLGYDYLACGNGLEESINCELRIPSDYELFKSTIDYYINEDKFMTYYITMSGHVNYDESHSIVKKNYDLVKDLPYSEKSKFYLSTQIELDRGLEVLINKLEENNKLDDTVIMLVGDHYPYGLSLDEINELSSYNRDNIFEKVKMPLIIYNRNLKDVNIDKYCSQIDILPTILNLFGVEYDSRLLLGKDIMSDGLSPIIFQNRSFITENGKYNAITEVFNGDGDKQYIEDIRNQIYNKFRISRLILEKDYYKYLKKM